MAVDDVLLQECVKLNYCYDSLLKFSCLPYSEQQQQKTEENWMTNIEKQALAIQKWLYVICNYCLIRDVVVLL